MYLKDAADGRRLDVFQRTGERDLLRIAQKSGPLYPQMNAITVALAAHSTMSRQALGADEVRAGLKDILLGPAQFYEALRARAAT